MTDLFPKTLKAALDYWTDAWQRTILTWDVLRERGNQYLEHERSGKPPLLVFDYEIIVDGRALERPANYALTRIKPPAGSPPTDAAKRPFVVIDPRAGHGPGIGGFKIDSEVGIALSTGHPCYFVMFFPEPVPGQTIESVWAAEIAFLRKVNELHPHAEGKPFLIGNSQGGWALMMLASLAPELAGPILLAGSPVSYWAGVAGQAPMRYTGGLLGGSWTASFAGDLGNGRFDGAYLVNNFERLDPANTLWTKLYNLYSKVDTERERFLQFEKWWGGHFLMNKEEMAWIARNLFVGNKLSAGEIQSADGTTRVDIRNIREPIIVFASWGDHITPPQQALNWIPDVYASVEDIRANEQTIVYSLHKKIGHLGIFVSAGVVRRETAELASALDMIETLPPGLYEAVIEDTQPDMPGLELISGRYLIKFVPRTVDDILALDDGRKDERAFEVVKRVSEINQGLYDSFASPVVKSLSSEWTASAIRALNPARVERYLFSDFNPWAQWVKAMAEGVRANRRPIAADNPFVGLERQVSHSIERSLDAYRDLRDDLYERTFYAIYGSPWLAAAVGLNRVPRRGPQAPTWEYEELKRLKRLMAESHMEEGTALDGWVRIVLYVTREGRVFDERAYNLARRMIDELEPTARPSLDELKGAVKRQAFLLALDEERAVAALPKLLTQGGRQRREALEGARLVAGAAGPLSADQERRLRRIERVLGADAAVLETIA
ncbi:MAG TPA: TerB family tellurite resistance protein [Burkholderiales bacterium]|nr:TerB family tellurite resistance protein [Burkholderiales bacterium]